VQAVGTRFLFLLGMAIGVVLVPVIFLWALATKRRPIHFDGVVCKAEVTALDPTVGTRLAGPALVRLSGGGQAENSTSADVLGFALRLQRTASTDLTVGDQDLIFGTFESFLSLPRTIKSVKVADYLANQFASVTPWRVDGLGVVHLRAMPPRDSVGPGADRVARLLADIAAGTAVFTLEARGADTVPLARVVLVERLPSDGKALRTSMWNNGRGFHPTGARNGIRAVVYGVSQLARGLRSG